MAAEGGGGIRVSKTTVQPIMQLFRFLTEKKRVQVWLVEQRTTRLEGQILGFDEYMNIVLDKAVEVDTKHKTRTDLGRLLLKGDNVVCVSPAVDR